MVYGGPPSMPKAKKETIQKLEAMSHEKTKEFLEAPLPDHDTDPPPPPDEYEKRRLRVVSRVDEEGLLCVKVYVDGKLVSESSANGTTVNIETDV